MFEQIIKNSHFEVCNLLLILMLSVVGDIVQNYSNYSWWYAVFGAGCNASDIFGTGLGSNGGGCCRIYKHFSMLDSKL